MGLQQVLVSLIMIRARRIAERYERASFQPLKAQKEKMLRIITKNKDTEYGVRYGFSTIRTIDDFQRQVPVVDYEDIRGDIDRVAEGQKNVLTAEDPVMFARTSGTMGKPKLIIVTPTCRGGEHSSVVSVWGYHLLMAHPDVYKGKTVSLVSTAIEGYTNGGIPYGSTSGSIYMGMPILFRRKYAIPYDVFTIKDYQAKYYTIMRLALEEDARGIGSANPSSIIKMCEKGDEYSEDIIKDIYDGTLSDKFSIEPEIRTIIENRVSPNPSRSIYLGKARNKRGGSLLPADYWPNLDIITCWKGGTVGHYTKLFPQWFNPDGKREIPIRDWGYLSSEARCSIPLSDKGSAGALAVETNFYEFVAVQEKEANPDSPGSWTYLNVSQLEDNGEYFIFITTMGGLYRYDINDIVRVEGYYNETPQITFVRKGLDMTSMTGEKLSVNQVMEAVNRTACQTGITPMHYKVEADVDNSRYVLRVELVGHISVDSGRAMLRCFDDNLKNLNIEYSSKRNSMRIGSPVLYVMRKGWYEYVLMDLAENGNRIFQSKIKVLSEGVLKTEKISEHIENRIEM